MAHNVNFISNTLFVSKTKGDNGSAQANNPFKPYADPWSALTAASVGDLIEVLDGVWNASTTAGTTPLGTTDKLIEGAADLNLFSKRVQWYFNSYTGVNYYNYGEAFTDYAPLFKPLSSDQHYFVDGNGEFNIYDFNASTTNNAYFLDVNVNNADIRVNANKFYSQAENGISVYNGGVSSTIKMIFSETNNVRSDGANGGSILLDVDKYKGVLYDYTLSPTLGECELEVNGEIKFHSTIRLVDAATFTLTNDCTDTATFDIIEGATGFLSYYHENTCDGFLNYTFKPDSSFTMSLTAGVSSVNVFKMNLRGSIASGDFNMTSNSGLKSKIIVSGELFPDDTIAFGYVSSDFLFKDIHIDTSVAESPAVASTQVATLNCSGFTYRTGYGEAGSLTLEGDFTDIA